MKKIFLTLVLFSLIAQIAFAQYCTAYGKDSNYRYIADVEFGQALHRTGNNGGYYYQSSPIFYIERGKCAHLKLVSGSIDGNYNPFYTKVWIDFNQDNDFTDAGEEVYSRSTGYYTSTHQRIDIPSRIPTGLTRLRVAFRKDSAPSACGEFEIGEVEDHLVKIVASDFYCTSQGASTYYEWIDNVGDPSFPNPDSGDNGGYANHLCGTTINGHFHFMQGYTGSISLKPGYASGSYPEGWKVWIDYNEDFVFDVYEEVFKVWPTTGTVSGNFDVPNLGKKIITRMRVQMKYNSLPMDPCETNFPYGETEDFIVTLWYYPPLKNSTPKKQRIACEHTEERNIIQPQTLPALPDEALNVSFHPSSQRLKAEVKLREPEKARLDLFDVRGRLITSKDWDGDEQLELLLPNGASGIYILVFSTARASLSRKVFIP